MKVGDTVWVCDYNHRIYRNGQSGPVFREYFVPRTIDAETRVSWVLSDGVRINKKTLSGCYPTQEAIDDACWVHEHSNALSRGVLTCKDASILRQIAGLLSWSPEEQ